jgi:hypothetical protein
MKDHLILFFVLLTGKLYAIGMLYTLNSRVMLRERMRSTDLGRTSLAGTWQWDQADETARIFGPLSEPPQALDAPASMHSSGPAAAWHNSCGSPRIDTASISDDHSNDLETADATQSGLTDAREISVTMRHRL